MSKVFTPPKCPDLQIPLIKVNGNDYMKVAHRLLWLVNEVKSYEIATTFVQHTETSATCRADITVYDDQGKAVRRVTAHKTEDTKGFKDFAEKAETGAIGRALAALGFGTAQAISDLDEGARIVDAPLEHANVANAAMKASFAQVATPVGATSDNPQGGSAPTTATGATVSSFRRKPRAAVLPTTVPEAATTTTAPVDGWSSETEWK